VKLRTEVCDTLEKINRNQWNELVVNLRLSSFFHQYEWLKAIEEGLDVRPRHIVVYEGENIVGCMPNFIISIKKTPFNALVSIEPGYGGLLIRKHQKKILSSLFNGVSRISKDDNVISHIIRTLDLKYAQYSIFFEGKGYRPNLESCRFEIQLSKGWERIQSDMDKKRRYNLKKGRLGNYEIEDEEITEYNVMRFYQVYKQVMNSVGGTIYPIDFFKSLTKLLKNRLKLFTFEVKGEYCGGFLHFLDESKFIVHHFFGAVKEDCFKHYPNELLHEFSIKWGIENNYEKYDFGATSLNFTNGLFKFKEGFGGKMIPILSWEKGYSTLRWKLYRKMRQMYRSLKT